MGESGWLDKQSLKDYWNLGVKHGLKRHPMKKKGKK